MSGLKPLPPYGRQYLDQHPDPGLAVVLGGDAWEFASRSTKPILVLPPDRDPSDYRWPSSGGPVLVHERGRPNDARLAALAAQLMADGSPSVVALRHSLICGKQDPRVFFEPLQDDHNVA